MCEQHLDLLPLATRASVLRRCRYLSRHISRVFMNAAGNLAERHVRATLFLHRAAGTTALARSIDDVVGLCNMGSRVCVCSPIAAHCVSSGASILVALFVPVELVSLE